MRNLLLPILSLVIIFQGCWPEDIIVEPHEQGDLQVGSVELGEDYVYQSYYDLNSNSEVSRNLVSDWDLAFESAGNGFRIILNSAKFMYAGNSHDTIFSNVTSEEGVDMYFDKSDGDPDSTAIGQWYEIIDDTLYSLREVYIIDRVIDANQQPASLKKVQFDFQGDAYRIRYADLDNQNEGITVIGKDPLKNFICFSFENGVINIEPDRTEWSFKFSKYTTMLQTDEGENYPYVVLGVVLNSDNVAAALDTVHEFMDIILADTIDLELRNDWDAIGYDWKFYNFDAGLYTIVPGYAYLLRDRDGYYYKLRFTDFYNDQLEKGSPEFEFIRL